MNIYRFMGCVLTSIAFSVGIKATETFGFFGALVLLIIFNIGLYMATGVFDIKKELVELGLKKDQR